MKPRLLLTGPINESESDWTGPDWTGLDRSMNQNQIGPISESEPLTPMNKSSETLIRINEVSLIAEKYVKHLT